MERSESIGQLAGALAKAHKAYKPLKKDTINPYYNSKYADLAAVIEATDEALSDNELVIVQLPSFADGKAIVKTIIAHSSGEFIAEDLPLTLPSVKNKETGEIIFKDDPQSLSISVSYGRRISYQAFTSVAAELDDDGNAASGKTVSASPKVNQTPAQPKNELRPKKELQKPALPKSEPANDQYPTKEELDDIKIEVRKWMDKVDRESVIEFIYKTSQVSDSKDVTKTQWKTIFDLLTKAEQSGKLNEVVKGE